MNEKTKLRVIQILCIVSLVITVFSIQSTYAKYFEQVNTTYATKIKRWVINVNNKNIHNEQTLSQVMTPVFVENEHMNNNNTLVPGREGYFPFTVNYEKVDLAFGFSFDLKQLNKKGEDLEEDNHLEDFEVYGYQVYDGENAIIDLEIENTKDIEFSIDPVENSIIASVIIVASREEFDLIKDAIESGESEIIGYEIKEEYGDGSKKLKLKGKIDLDEDKKIETRVLFRWNDENADTTDENDMPGMNNYEDTQYEGTVIEGDSVHTSLDYRVKVTFTQQL